MTNRLFGLTEPLVVALTCLGFACATVVRAQAVAPKVGETAPDFKFPCATQEMK